MTDAEKSILSQEIAIQPCGDPPEGWSDFAGKFDKDAWQIAFTAGLMSAISVLDRQDSPENTNG